MKCIDVTLHLQALVKGTLADDKRRDLEGHLERCGACRTRRAEEEDLYRRFERVETPAPGEDYWTHFASRVDDRLDDEPPSWLRLVAPFAARGAVVASLAAFLVWGGYLAGREPAPVDGPSATFASFEPGGRSVSLFQEMIALFPERLIWLSDLNGKVDFSVAPEELDVDTKLVPLALDVTAETWRVKGRFLVRTGHSARATVILENAGDASIEIELADTGESATVRFRLDGERGSSGIESTVDLVPDKTSTAGTFIWRGEPVPVYLSAASKQTLYENKDL